MMNMAITFQCQRCEDWFLPDPNHYGYPEMHRCQPAPLPLDSLVEAMNDAYTYERYEYVPDLPFCDDIEGFWRPFAAKVLARLATPEPTEPANPFPGYSFLPGGHMVRNPEPTEDGQP